jgi:16S rRNA processing protein RimM
MVNDEAWVALAEVARPHGVRGELRLKLYNRDSDLLLELDEVLVRLPDGVEHEVSIDAARRADQSILLKLHSIDSRERADELRGAQLCAKRSAFPPPEPGEFYVCDIVGAEVSMPSGPLGTVRELRSYPSVDTLVIKALDGGRDWEVPLVAAFVREVDAARGIVTLETIDGLER